MCTKFWVRSCNRSEAIYRSQFNDVIIIVTSRLRHCAHTERQMEPQNFWIWIFSRQGPQTGASHRRAVMCEQLAQGCYLRVQWLGIEPTTSRSLRPTR